MPTAVTEAQSVPLSVLTIATKDDFIAVLQIRALLSGWEDDLLLTPPRHLQQRPGFLPSTRAGERAGTSAVLIGPVEP